MSREKKKNKDKGGTKERKIVVRREREERKDVERGRREKRVRGRNVKRGGGKNMAHDRNRVSKEKEKCGE